MSDSCSFHEKTIFFGGTNRLTPKKVIWDYFSTFGEIESVQLQYKECSHSHRTSLWHRGCGEVTFKSNTSFQKAMRNHVDLTENCQLDNLYRDNRFYTEPKLHIIEGREIEVRATMTCKARKEHENQIIRENRKVFIMGL